MAVDDEQEETKMETEEKLSSENDVKENGESDKSHEEKVESAPAVKHLEENELFSTYYLGQEILTADEVDQFCEFVKKPLPCTFRISNLGSNMSEVHTMLKSNFLSKNSEAASSLPWYPNELAWQVNVQPEPETRMEELNQFIANETACGNVEQQDAVGMVPALLLNIEPRHKLLDMRATKSVQLLDLVHGGSTVLDKKTDGVVIACEPYHKRCCDLAEFIPYLFSPHFAIANFDPVNLHGLVVENKENERESIKYDRILCDLISSNDGMCRNSPGGLHNWSPTVSHEHHGRMCRMLHFATCHLAVGGRLVFYTYSMNPIENEAVIATLLTQQKGSVELVDVSAELTNLQYKNGLNKWKVMTRGGRWFEDYAVLQNTLRYRVNESVFPPPTEKADKFHLERCVRILPHQQNTAGMFIGVVRRTRALEDVLKEEREAWAKAQQEKAEAAKKRAEEAKLAAEKAAAEKAAAEKAAAAAAEKEAAKKAEDEERQKSEEKSSGGEDVDKATKETAMDTSSVTEKAADESKRDDSSKTKEEPKKLSSESKKETHAAASGDESKTKSSHEKERSGDESKTKSSHEKERSGDESKTKSSHEKERSGDTKMAEDKSLTSREQRHDADSRHSRHTHDDDVPAKRPRRDMPVGDLYNSVKQDDPIWTSIRDFFGISSDFPLNQLLSRGDEKTSLFYVSPTLKHLIDCNQSTVNFVHAGVKAFCRMSDAASPCKYRITQEGLPAIYPFLSRQTVQLTKEEFVELLNSQPVPINSFSSKTKQVLSKLEKGNVVFVCRLNPRKADSSQLMVTSWSDGLHCRTFLAHYRRLHYLRACGVTVADPDKKPLAVSATEAITAFARAAAAMERY